MRVIVDGKIDRADAGIREGTSGFSLSDDNQEALELALADIQRGDYTDGRELLRQLKDSAGR